MTSTSKSPQKREPAPKIEKPIPTDIDPVDEASQESFPASDSPAYPSNEKPIKKKIRQSAENNFCHHCPHWASKQ